MQAATRAIRPSPASALHRAALSRDAGDAIHGEDDVMPNAADFRDHGR